MGAHVVLNLLNGLRQRDILGQNEMLCQGFIDI